MPTTLAVAPTTVAGVPPATQPPTGLGTDPTMDALAQSCFAGDMQACDDLYYQSPIGSAYEAYGTSCAGRSTSDIPGSCVSTFTPEAAPTTVANLPPAPAATQPPTGLGTDPAMDALAQSCFAGDMQGCDELYFASPIGSAYEAYAETCAGRTESFAGMCSATFASTSAGPAPTTVPAGPTTVPAVPTTARADHRGGAHPADHRRRGPGEHPAGHATAHRPRHRHHARRDGPVLLRR